MNWVKLAVIALEIVGAFVRWVEAEKIASEAERALIARARRMIDANVAIAEDARARVRDALAANPDKLREPDEFVRPD